MRRKKIRTRSWAKMRKSLSKKHLINGRRRWLNRRLPLKSKNRDWKLEIPKHLIKDLPDKVTQRELKEVFKDAFQIRLVSKDGMNKRIAYADFKSQADAERALEDKQGTKIGGLAIALDPVGEKSQGQEERGWKNSTWRTKDTDTMMKASLSMKLTQNRGERKMKKKLVQDNIFELPDQASPEVL
ncbi:nucleolin-like isoform X4 [Lynx canadensis]|uniref:nucleolin-like isoform X4 n=1 Tax=Lynx canadensis TaxID=61383 RepID=UPI0011B01837|nr:nucleolin-like isoform X4 [Lynx canadensis]